MSATTSAKSNELMLTFGLFVGYGLYSLLRKSYSVALPLMRATLSLSKTDVGNIATSFSVAYGISKFIGGVVSDFLPPEAMFAVGLFLTALSNVFFSLSTSTTVLCIFWFFNGAVQGFGWPALSQIVNKNLDPSRAGTTWSILITGGNVGYLLGPFLLLPLTRYGWEIPFRISGLFGMLFACIIYQILITGGAGGTFISNNNQDKEPLCADKKALVTSGKEQKVNILSPEKSSKISQKKINDINNINDRSVDSKIVNTTDIDNASAKVKFKVKETESKEESKMKILYGCAFSLNLWLLMLVGGLTTFVLKSMADWTGLFLIEHCGLDISLSTELMLWNEMGGIIGTLLCGLLSDYIGGNLTLLIFVAICIPPMMYFPTQFDQIPVILEVLDRTQATSLSSVNDTTLSSFISNIPINSIIRNTLSACSTKFGLFSGSIGIAKICLFFMGFGINGPKTLLGVMVRDLVPLEVSGTVGGIFGLIAQVGASVSGAGLGYLLEELGWESYMGFLLYGTTAIAICLILPILTSIPKSKNTIKKKKID